MAAAYHMEALRKQRIIDRKHAALAKIALTEHLQETKKRRDEERYKYELAEKEHEKTRKREEYLNSMGRTGKSSKGVIGANYVYMLEEQKKRISQKDLRHQEKTLRDHCLVMGHVNDKFMA
ncbi:hypothetical protein ACROYT_G019844 [Oculina patagonica]